MMLGVIIPTRNRADLLQSALDSLLRQTLPVFQFEVLVVDNASSDDTPAVGEAFAQRLPNLRYFYEPEPGLHAGRHRGMLEARGEILVFADDDIEAPPTWLASILEAFADPDVVMVGGNNLPKFDESPPVWLSRIWDRGCPDGSRMLPALSIIEMPGPARTISPLNVWGCNFSVRKETLLAAGGFHPDGMPRELIRFRGDGETHVSRWVEKTGGKCLFHPGATVYHKVTSERMTADYFHKRGFMQGISDSYTALRNEKYIGSSQKIKLLQRILLTRHLLRGTLVLDKGIRDSQREFARGHREGYSFHQQAYESDPDVRAWVHKDKYF